MSAAPEAIGYYNPNEYPVSWSRHANGRNCGLTNLEPGQPVTDQQGFLVGHDDELERLVRDRMLARATTAMPNFAEWNEVRTRQIGSKIRKVGANGQPVERIESSANSENADRARTSPPEAPPSAHVSAKTGVTENRPPAPEAKPTAEAALPSDVERLEGGGYRYQGMAFDSAEAVMAFVIYLRNNQDPNAG